jgi:hypothetical protein
MIQARPNAASSAALGLGPNVATVWSINGIDTIVTAQDPGVSGTSRPPVAPSSGNHVQPSVSGRAFVPLSTVAGTGVLPGPLSIRGAIANVGGMATISQFRTFYSVHLLNILGDHLLPAIFGGGGLLNGTLLTSLVLESILSQEHAIDGDLVAIEEVLEAVLQVEKR